MALRDRNRRRREERPASPARKRASSKTPEPEPTEDELDKRTIFVQQLAARLRTKELMEFFERAGPVKEAQIVRDRISGSWRPPPWLINQQGNWSSSRPLLPKSGGREGQKHQGLCRTMWLTRSPTSSTGLLPVALKRTLYLPTDSLTWELKKRCRLVRT